MLVASDVVRHPLASVMRIPAGPKVPGASGNFARWFGVILSSFCDWRIHVSEVFQNRKSLEFEPALHSARCAAARSRPLVGAQVRA